MTADADLPLFAVGSAPTSRCDENEAKVAAAFGEQPEVCPSGPSGPSGPGLELRAVGGLLWSCAGCFRRSLSTDALIQNCESWSSYGPMLLEQAERFVPPDLVSPLSAFSHDISSTIGPILENLADVSHFGVLHEPLGRSELVDFGSDSDRFWLTTNLWTGQSSSPVRVDSTVFRSGLSAFRQTDRAGNIKSAVIGGFMPDGAARTRSWSRIWVPRSGSAAADRARSKAILRKFKAYARQDSEILGHQRTPRRPLLLPEDGPIRQMRIWYSEGWPSLTTAAFQSALA